MKSFQLFIAMSFCTMILGGCAALTRNQCEKINWFERGQNLALEGKYPANDPQLKECRKVEAKIEEGQLDSGFKRGRELYCQPERAYVTGKDGKLFATDICDQSIIRGLLKKHAEGVRAFCVPETGKQLGASGGAYNTICPADLEAPFKSAYSKARKGYLEGIIPGLQQEMYQKQGQIGGKKSELSFLQGQKAVLNGQLVGARSNYASAAQTMQLENQVNDLDHQIRMKQNEISGMERDINTIMSKISNIQGEIAGLKD